MQLQANVLSLPLMVILSLRFVHRNVDPSHTTRRSSMLCDPFRFQLVLEENLVVQDSGAPCAGDLFVKPGVSGHKRRVPTQRTKYERFSRDLSQPNFHDQMLSLPENAGRSGHIIVEAVTSDVLNACFIIAFHPTRRRRPGEKRLDQVRRPPQNSFRSSRDNRF
jgi:hypothetical protein